MPAPNRGDQLFGTAVILAEVGPGVWAMRIFNGATGHLEPVGNAPGSGGVSPLILPADPPDFVTTEDGDIIMVENRDG